MGNSGKVIEIAVPFDFNDSVAAGSATLASTPFSCRAASHALAALAPGGLPPIGAVVQNTDLKVLTTFDGGVAVKVGTAAAPDVWMLANQNDPVTLGTYSNDDRSAPLGAAAAVQVTLDATGAHTQCSAAPLSAAPPLSRSQRSRPAACF